MQLRLHLALILSVVLIAAGQPAMGFDTQESFNIGIVTDGPNTSTPWLVNTFKKQISRMAEGEFEVSFPDEMVLEANGSVENVKQLLDQLLDNPETDLILTLGAIGSTEAVGRVDLVKPVVAPFIFDADMQKAPRDGVGSGIQNLFFIDLHTPVDQELIVFRKLLPFDHMVLLVDERDANGVPAFGRLASYLANEHSIKVELVKVGDSVLDALEQIPAEVKAAMVGPLWQISAGDVETLAKGFIERGIAAFSMANFRYVEQGLFATTMPDGALEQMARQVAINVQELLLGEEAASLPVAFSKSQRLAINMATARAISVYPGLEYMTGAHLLNEERTDIERKVTLPEVVAEALEANLDLAAAKSNVAAGEYRVGEAKSALWPQIGIGAGGRVIDDDRAEAAQGSNPEKAFTGRVTASQQIYSESSWSSYSVAKYNQAGREYDRDTVRLDIMFDASTAYLNVLRRLTVEKLQKENMQLTQSNLERAQIRLSSGVAGPDELYRWQTKFANDRQVVLQAESATFDAKQGLNRILNRPLREEFIAKETDLNDPLLIGGNTLFYELIHNPVYFSKFMDFSIETGLAASPELQAFDATIQARERRILQARREYWLPTFSVDASLEHQFSDSGAGQLDDSLTGLDETGWQVGVFATLPLIEGGRKGATLSRNREQLNQLKTEKMATEDRIRQRILQALNNTRASYPSINLSRDAVDAARRNLTLVTDSYVQGIKSIIDLLDAQNQALNAELDAANAVYNFLIDLMGVQRSIGTFVTFLPDEERELWLKATTESLQLK